MDTIINKWQEEEINEINALFFALEDYIKSDPEDKKTTSDIIKNITKIGQNNQGPNGKNGFNIKFIRGTHLFSRGEYADQSLKKLNDLRKMLSRKAKWGEYREIDDIIIHFHMKRKYENESPGSFKEIMVRNANPYKLDIEFSSQIDVVEIDDLGLHIAAKEAEKFTDLKNKNAEEKKEILRQALKGTAMNSKSPNILKREGCFLRVRKKDEKYKIEGNTVTLTAKIPETIFKSAKGKPLHNFINIEGYKSEAVIIKDIQQKMDEIEITINRYDKNNRIRIEI